MRPSHVRIPFGYKGEDTFSHSSHPDGNSAPLTWIGINSFDCNVHSAPDKDTFRQPLFPSARRSKLCSHSSGRLNVNVKRPFEDGVKWLLYRYLNLMNWSG